MKTAHIMLSSGASTLQSNLWSYPDCRPASCRGSISVGGPDLASESGAYLREVWAGRRQQAVLRRPMSKKPQEPKVPKLVLLSPVAELSLAQKRLTFQYASSGAK